jgi:hypothetical protein
MLKKIAVVAAGLALAVGALSAPALAQTSSSALDTPTHSIPVPHAAKADAPTKGVKALKGTPPSSKPGNVSAFTTCSGTCYSYVAGAQAVTNTGAAGTFQVQSPYLKSTDYHSLAENALIRDDGAGVKQIVELGWTKDVTVCGAGGGPCLFVFQWKNGSSASSCYNGCGWVDYAANTTVNAGTALTNNQQMAYRWLYDATTPAGGAWWAWVDPDAGGPTAGDWIGYFPQSVWSGLAVPFTSANNYNLFFELASVNVESCSDMGNGEQGSGGAGASPRPSFIASASYFSGGAWNNGSLTNYVLPTGTTKWSYNTASARTFYGGGPGWNAAGTAVGSVGSC